jgi:hypothetical protein
MWYVVEMRTKLRNIVGLKPNKNKDTYLKV